MAEAAKKKLKFTNFVSPTGVAKYCWVNKPDLGYDGKGDPKFKTDVYMADTVETRAWCEAVMAKAQAEAKAQGIKLKKVFHTPFTFPEDIDDDDFIPAEGKDRAKYDESERGKIIVSSKSGFKPGLIDSQRNELDEDVKIMGGDVIRIKFEPYAYEGLGSGITFRLKVVQLIEKNTSYSGGKANLDGFDDVEGGYTAPAGSDLDDEIPF